MVAGPDDWSQVASNMGVQAAMVIDESGVIFATQAMMEFFTPTEGREVTVVVAD